MYKQRDLEKILLETLHTIQGSPDQKTHSLNNVRQSYGRASFPRIGEPPKETPRDLF